MVDSNVLRDGVATPRRTRGCASRLVLCASVAALFGGCSTLTDVDSDLVVGEDLDNAEGALALRAGAFGAFTNSVRLSVIESGMLTDELTLTDPADRSEPLDLRAVTEQQTGTSSGFTGRQDALEFTAQAIAAMRQHVPEPGSLTGDLYARRGYTLTLLAEEFCSGVPVATFRDGRPTPAAAHTTDELFELALAAFDSAAALAGDTVRLSNLAAVGRGRALLGLGRFADASAAVAGVPTDFAEQVEFSDESFLLWNSVSRAFPDRTVADGEGKNGLPFVSMADPRLDLQPAGLEGDATSMRPAKYASTATPIVFADGVEARLVEAEAALNAGDIDGWLATHNALRAIEALPPLTDPGTAGARVDLHFAERAAWLFLTSHRLGDLRRLTRHYGRDPEATFPTGLYKGGPESYGSATSFPVPEDERANPNFTGCLQQEA